jgi:hypothetical protein
VISKCHIITGRKAVCIHYILDIWTKFCRYNSTFLQERSLCSLFCRWVSRLLSR